MDDSANRFDWRNQGVVRGSASPSNLGALSPIEVATPEVHDEPPHWKEFEQPTPTTVKILVTSL
jgi:hypothetical protein